jgi:O-antigen/teichoic acid export membrane protein
MKIINFASIKSLFFDNKTVKQMLFKNTFWLFVGLGISKFLKMALIIYVARILGATEYGKFTFALAFVSIFIIFSDLGLPNIVIREFSHKEGKEKEFYSILSLKILSSFGMLILVLIGSFFITLDPAIRKLIWVLGAFSAVEAFSTIIYVFFQALQRMEYQAWVTIFESLVVTALGFFVILNYPSVENLSYAYLFSSFIALIFLLLFFHFKIFHLQIAWQKSVWRKFLVMSWPLALTGLFVAFYSYIDSVILGYWGMITETGWYNAAYKIIFVTLIPAGLISGSFYPVLSKFFKESKEKLQKIWSYQLEIMILLALPLMVGGMVLAPKIIYFLYPLDFTPSILAFQILIITAGLIFLNRPFSDVMIACNQQKKTFWITLFGALVNIILNLILIPKYSLYGAAWATVITYILVSLMYLRYTMKFTSIRPFNLRIFLTFLTSAISAALMYFVLKELLIYNINIFLLALAAIYFMVFLAIRKYILLGYFKQTYV